MTESTMRTGAVSYRLILKTWWPLAFSWLLMSVEMPAISAVIARLANPEINLAAYGGIVFPLSLIIEAPVIMLLGASTALSKHMQAYRRIWQYMMAAGGLLTALHVLVAFTPLYYFVVRRIIGVPEEIVEPARIGLMLMVPWTWSIAYRRFNQGVMIRFGHSGAIGMGTIIRLVTGGVILTVGYIIGDLPGVAVGAAAQGLGVLSEALYTGWRVRPVLRGELAHAPITESLTWRAFAAFYVPLALTSLIQLLWQPVGSAALSRMPDPITSLAVWPVLSGLMFLLRSSGIAYNEVTVALIDREGAYPKMRRFTFCMAGITTALHLLIAATPLAWLYFSRLSALPEDLARIAALGFWIALPIPALTVLQSWFQGSLLVGKRTRGVPESVVVFFVTVLVVLAAGVAWGGTQGLYVNMVGFVLANAAQMAWLAVRGRPVLKTFAASPVSR